MKNPKYIYEDSDIMDFTDREGDRRDIGCFIVVISACVSAIGVALFLVYLANTGVL